MLETQELKDVPEATSLGVDDVDPSKDVGSSDSFGESPLDNQSGDQFEFKITNSYQNTTAETGDTLPWGVQASWDGIDYSGNGDFAEDKYAFVIDSGVSNSTGDLNIHQTWSRSWVDGESWSDDLNGH